MLTGYNSCIQCIRRLVVFFSHYRLHNSLSVRTHRFREF